MIESGYCFSLAIIDYLVVKRLFLMKSHKPQMLNKNPNSPSMIDGETIFIKERPIITIPKMT